MCGFDAIARDPNVVIVRFDEPRVHIRGSGMLGEYAEDIVTLPRAHADDTDFTERRSVDRVSETVLDGDQAL